MGTRATIRFIDSHGRVTANVGIQMDGDPASIRKIFIDSLLPGIEQVNNPAELFTITKIPVFFVEHMQTMEDGIGCHLLGELTMLDSDHDYEVTIHEVEGKTRIILRHVQNDTLLEVIEF